MLGGGDGGRGDRGGADAGVHRAGRQRRGEQLGHGLGAALGETEPAARVGVQGEVRAPARRGQARVAEQCGEQRAQEAVDGARGQSARGEGPAGGELGAAEQPLDRGRPDAGERGAEPAPVERAAEGRGARGGARGGLHGTRHQGGARQGARRRSASRAPSGRGLRRPAVPAVTVDQDAGGEGAQDERVETRRTAQFRVGGGATGRSCRAGSRRPSRRHPAADVRSGPPGQRSLPRCWSAVARPEPRGPGPHDDDVRMVRRL
ncbi:hypothetical protein SALBM135S_09739 [Streptomyces alboniger]